MTDRADLDVCVSANNQIVIASVHLDTRPEHCKQLVSQATSLARKHGITRFLFDVSTIKRGDTRAEQYEEVQNLGKSGLLRSDRIALVVPPHSDEHDYINMLVQDEGYNHQLFRSREKAEQWLLEDD